MTGSPIHKRGDIGARLQLSRDIHLIVIHTDDAVKFASQRPLEDGIGRQRTGDADIGARGIMDGGGDHIDFLVSEKPALAPVRIERGDGDARGVMSELGENLIQVFDVAARRDRG